MKTLTLAVLVMVIGTAFANGNEGFSGFDGFTLYRKEF